MLMIITIIEYLNSGGDSDSDMHDEDSKMLEATVTTNGHVARGMSQFIVYAFFLFN